MSTTTAPNHMTTDPAPTRTSSARYGAAARRTGWALTVITTLFLGFDAVTHLLAVEPVMDANRALGAPDHLVPICGVVLSAVLVAYLTPATRAMGTVLLTAYLGGAVAVNLVAEQPVANVGFAVATAVIAWAGVWPRDARLRALVGR